MSLGELRENRRVPTPIGMMPAGRLLPSGLDLILRGVLRDAKNGVVVLQAYLLTHIDFQRSTRPSPVRPQ
jgi:hypothetical protein